jgi:uncharacterized coiled-coil DUF342 family protein
MVINMEAWEKRDAINGILREIDTLNGRKKKLNSEGWKINYNSTTGQKQFAKLQQDILDVDNQISTLYDELKELQSQPEQQLISTELSFYDQLDATVKPQGNGAHITVPKSKIGCRVKVLFLDPEF